MRKLFAWSPTPALLLRLGLAMVLGYAAVSALVSPEDWIGYLPNFVRSLADAATPLKLFSVYQLGLVVWLLCGWRMDLAGLVCAATFAGIVASNLSPLQITFRDVAFLFASLALASLGRRQIDAANHKA